MEKLAWLCATRCRSLVSARWPRKSSLFAPGYRDELFTLNSYPFTCLGSYFLHPLQLLVPSTPSPRGGGQLAQLDCSTLTGFCSYHCENCMAVALSDVWNACHALGLLSLIFMPSSSPLLLLLLLLSCFCFWGWASRSFLFDYLVRSLEKSRRIEQEEVSVLGAAVRTATETCQSTPLPIDANFTPWDLHDKRHSGGPRSRQHGN